MVDFHSWSGHSPADESHRARRNWNSIQKNPASIVLVRSGVTLAAQTVTVSLDSTEALASGESNQSSVKRDAVVFGVRNHPDVPDTNIQHLDRFAYGGQVYIVNDVVWTRGGVQAFCTRYT